LKVAVAKPKLIAIAIEKKMTVDGVHGTVNNVSAVFYGGP